MLGPLKTPSELNDQELLKVLLGSRNELICEQLTSTYSDLRSLSNAQAIDLKDYGLTSASIERLNAVFEVARRYAETPWQFGQPLRGSVDVYAHFKERLAAETREHFFAVLLDNKHRLIRTVCVSVGSLTASVVHPRDVYSVVVRYQAAAVIFVHNHPSGDPTPSREDIEITRRLREVGDVLGVRVLDHVIIGKGRYVSLVDDGYW